MSTTEAQEVERCAANIVRDGNIQLTIGPAKHGLPREDLQRVAITLTIRKDVFNAHVGADNYLHVVPNYGRLRGDAREAFTAQMVQTIAQAIVHKRSYPGGGTRARNDISVSVNA